MNDEFLGGSIPGIMSVEVPEDVDANQNGFPDFYEVSQAVAVNSSGQYEFQALGSGTIEASWQRSAGSAVGTCVFEFAQGPLVWDVFTHTFSLLEYNGPLRYTPGTNVVSGDVKLLQSGAPENSFTGRVDFAKSPQDRLNVLRLEAGVWTNANLYTLTYTNAIISRDLQLKTNYYGYLLFDDGFPDTSDADYRVWVISIDDSYDADADGIPDFSDDPQAAPTGPRLELSGSPGNLLLIIEGKVGQNCEVQEAAELSTRWRPIGSTTLTNETQAFLLPFSGSPRFWRVQVR
jgi:hypothetical protein